VQDPKYGPLSQQILTHEAFRAAGERLCVAVGGLGATSKSGAVSGPALADFALQVRLRTARRACKVLSPAWVAAGAASCCLSGSAWQQPTACS
jgi:hypothetical protein